ncbi:MAG TPA: hemerythrin domain-containing protein [Agriterribacter sp.]|nr:hemerythrin domain-containing protein [Agriterribacter sp.]
MEKKPIQRNEHIVSLSKDHHATLLFCWKIRTGLKHEVDVDRMLKYVQYFWQQHQQLHFLEEETILFAPLVDDKVQRALDEHIQIQEKIQALRTAEDVVKLQLTSLAEFVYAHVRYEERELFPNLEQVLTNEQLENIGKQLSEKHSTSKDDFADLFWLNKK